MPTDVSASPKLLLLCCPCFGAALVGQSPCCSQHTSAHSLPCAAAAFPAPSPSPLAILCCAGYHRRLLGRDFGFLGFLHMEASLVLLQALGSVWGCGVHWGVLPFGFLGLCSGDVLEQELLSSSEFQVFPWPGLLCWMTLLACDADPWYL